LNNIQLNSLADQNAPVTFIQLPTNPVLQEPAQSVLKKGLKRGRKPSSAKGKQQTAVETNPQQDDDIANNLAQELNNLYGLLKKKTTCSTRIVLDCLTPPILIPDPSGEQQQQTSWIIVDQKPESNINVDITYQSAETTNSTNDVKQKRRACECPNCYAYVDEFDSNFADVYVRLEFPSLFENRKPNRFQRVRWLSIPYPFQVQTISQMPTCK
jgi:hypothetical protein